MWRRVDGDCKLVDIISSTQLFFHSHLAESPTVKTGNESSKLGAVILEIYFEPKQQGGGTLHNSITGTFELYKHVSQW